MNDGINKTGSLAAGQRRVDRGCAGLAAAIHQEIPAIIHAIGEIDIPNIGAFINRLSPNDQILRIVNVNGSRVVLGSLISADRKVVAAEIGTIGIDRDVAGHVNVCRARRDRCVGLADDGNAFCIFSIRSFHGSLQRSG